MVPNTLKHYTIVRQLGSGGMGEVYLARDTKLDRSIALKVLPASMAGDPERRDRFEREAKVIAALNHPNIVTVHSVEQADEVHFITMELVEGRTLAEIIPRGGFPLETFLTLAIPLADAVAAAHERGITHRDLKPANVMVTGAGRVKVLDFGLAKLKEAARTDGPELPTRELTGEGRIVGTVAYMSPEQAEGRALDHRSDIFSLGVVLYEMATGERPFKGDTSVSLLSSILRDTPPAVTDLNARVPRDLARIVRRMLVKDVEHRYQTAKDVRNDLETLKEDLASGEIQQGPVLVPLRDRARWPAIVGALGALALGAAGILVFRSSSTAPAQAPRPFESMRMTRLTATGQATRAAISPDGKYVTHVVADRDGESLRMRQVATTSDVEIVAPAEIRYNGVAFSPDGTYVYYSAYAGQEALARLYSVPALGGVPRQVLEDIDSAVSFSPDGQRLAFLRGIPREGYVAVMVARADGSDPRQLTKVNFPLGNVSWSPDGDRLATPLWDTQEGTFSVAVVEAATGALRKITSDRWEYVASVAWLPDGERLVVTGARGSETIQVWLVDADTGVSRRITNDLNQYPHVSLSEDGRSLVAVRSQIESRLWMAPGGEASRARLLDIGGGEAQGFEGLSWMPGRRLLFYATMSGLADIWAAGPDGADARPLTSDPAFDHRPVASPDGRYILFISDRVLGDPRAREFRIWRMRADGGGATALVPASPVSQLGVSPDSRTVYFDRWEVGPELWVVSIDGGSPTRLETPRMRFRALSPDGSRIAGVEQHEGAYRIVVVPATGGGPVVTAGQVAASPEMMAWSPDGRAIVHVVTRGGVSNLFADSLDGSPPKQVTHFTSERIFWFAYAPDGKDLALARGSEISDVVRIENLVP